MTRHLRFRPSLHDDLQAYVVTVRANLLPWALMVRSRSIEEPPTGGLRPRVSTSFKFKLSSDRVCPLESRGRHDGCGFNILTRSTTSWPAAMAASISYAMTSTAIGSKNTSVVRRFVVPGAFARL
jgi:hypothetical protein